MAWRLAQGPVGTGQLDDEKAGKGGVTGWPGGGQNVGGSKDWEGGVAVRSARSAGWGVGE